MMMMSLKFTGQIPFKEVYITGLIRDAEGHKMSKSKGNVLDPIDLIDGIALDDLVAKRTYGLMQPAMAQKIEKSTRKEFAEGIPSFGTDALRFTFCSMATYTREIRFDINRLGGYRNFCNKLWNAARYVMMNTEGKDTGIGQEKLALSLADTWILSRLQKTIETAHAALKEYRFDLYAHTIYDFTWNEFCDWYLEFSKPVLTATDTHADFQRGTRHTLVYTLEAILRLLHPIMPFITEAIWQRAAPLAGVSGKTIMLQPYPQVNKDLINDQSERELEWLKSVIVSIRTIRSEMNISPAKLVPILLRKGSELDKRNLDHLRPLLMTLAKVETISWLANNESPPPASSAFVGDLEIYLPMAGFINVEEETARLKREIVKLEKDFALVSGKLKNPSFVDRAPAEVVEKEKARLSELTMAISKLEKQMGELIGVRS